MTCPRCGTPLEIGQWPFCDGAPEAHTRVASRFNMPAITPAERTAVYYHPETGEVRYPGRADVPMPARYEAGGFVRREFESLQSLRAFEREQGVSAEHTWLNSSTDALPEPPTLTEKLETIKENERQLYREVGLSHLIGPDGAIAATDLDSTDMG